MYIIYDIRYNDKVNSKDVLFIGCEIKTPPFSFEARVEAGHFLWMVQSGELLSMPISRPMPSIGARCHELRINSENGNMRIIYRIDDNAILVVDVFKKKSQKTPIDVVERCRMRLARYDSD